MARPPSTRGPELRRLTPVVEFKPGRTLNEPESFQSLQQLLIMAPPADPVLEDQANVPPSVPRRPPSLFPALFIYFVRRSPRSRNHAGSAQEGPTGLPKHPSVSWTSRQGVLDMWPDERPGYN